MKKNVLFDFDGVIVDSFEACFATSEEFHPDRKGFTRGVYRDFFNGNVYEVAVSHNPSESKVAKDDPWFAAYTKRLEQLTPVEGIHAVLENLVQAYDLSIISSSLNASVERFLHLHNLDKYFEQILGADIHKSKVVKMEKLLAEKQLPETDALFITDTLGDIREAKKVGVSSLGVTWGFHSKEHLLIGEPNAVVSRPLDILPEINRILS